MLEDQLNRITKRSREQRYLSREHDKKRVRFYLPLQPKNPDDPVWSVIRNLSENIGEQLTTHLRAIATPILWSKASSIAWTSSQDRWRRDLIDDA